MALRITLLRSGLAMKKILTMMGKLLLVADY
jgi:hypothetical protein